MTGQGESGADQSLGREIAVEQAGPEFRRQFAGVGGFTRGGRSTDDVET